MGLKALMCALWGCEIRDYRGTSLIRNSDPSQDPHRALSMGLL